MLNRTFSKTILFAIASVAALIFVAMALLIRSSFEQTSNQEHTLNVTLTSDNRVESLTTVSATPKEEVVYTTPIEHDQLLVSPSLSGTNIDGALQAGEDKQLILNIGIRDFFDYFLSTADDIGPEIAIAEIQRYAKQYLPEPAQSQAIQLLKKYLRFKKAEFQLQQTPIAKRDLSNQDAINLMRENFETLKSKRQDLFNLDQDRALFSLEDTYAEHTLASLELAADKSLSDEQRQYAMQNLENALPPELSNSFAQTRTQMLESNFINSQVESSLDNAQVHANLLERGVSNNKADDIIQRRQQQADFNESYERYKSQLSSLDASASDHDTQKQRLMRRFFATPEEQTQAKLRELEQN